MMYLTKKQKKVYDFLNDYIKEKGYAPSIKEIAEYFGSTSLANIHLHLKNLEKKGLIKKEGHRSRAIEIIPQEKEYEDIEIPVFGYISENSPIENREQLEFIRVPEKLLERGHLFALVVKGNYLKNADLKDGDYLICESRKKAEDGEIALIIDNDGVASLYEVFFEKEKLILRPANPEDKLLFVDKDDVRIKGIVAGVIRIYQRKI